VDPAEHRSRYGALASRITRKVGDVLDPAVLDAALVGADAVHACFHAPYDSRVWARDLPPREQAVLDAADRADVPVTFPESMYAWVGAADPLREGDPFAPVEDKGRIRADLLRARRVHHARTLSLIASDLIGPSGVGTGGTIAGALVIEPVAAGRRPWVTADPDQPHTLTFIPDLVSAMLLAAVHAEELTGDSRDAILHAPSAPARTLTELAAAAAAATGQPTHRPHRIPRTAVRAAGLGMRLMKEIAGLAPIWYGPCRLETGVLEQRYGLTPTSWEEAVRVTAVAALEAKRQDHSQVAVAGSTP
jgi:nucleoside-diphosphate-sugar epimerase